MDPRENKEIWVEGGGGEKFTSASLTDSVYDSKLRIIPKETVISDLLTWELFTQVKTHKTEPDIEQLSSQKLGKECD